MAAFTAVLSALLAVPMLATPAAAAPSVTVVISEVTTPLAVSVDVGGTVTWINSIPARTDLLGVTLATDVTLAVPSGSHQIQPGGSWSEVFYSSCLTCTVTYKYRVTAGILPPLSSLPTLPASLPMVVNTIAPLPTVAPPPVNVPGVPAPGVPSTPSTPGATPGTPGVVPGSPGAPGVGGTPGAGTTSPGVSVGEPITPSSGGPLVLGAPGLEQRGSSTGPSGTSGSGTSPGTFAGAQHDTAPAALGVPALLAVLLLSVVAASLIRTTSLVRGRAGVPAGSTD